MNERSYSRSTPSHDETQAAEAIVGLPRWVQILRQLQAQAEIASSQSKKRSTQPKGSQSTKEPVVQER